MNTPLKSPLQHSRRNFLKRAALLPAAAALRPDLYDDLWALQAEQFAAVQPQRNRPNILIILLDTLSARHMSLYGYERDTTPNLKQLAEKAVVYHTHYSGGSFTTPGTASLLTGAFPWSHRAVNMHGTMRNDFAERSFLCQAEDDTYTLAYTHNILAHTLLEQFKDDVDLFLRPRFLAEMDNEYSDRLFPKDFNVSFWAESLILRGRASRPSSLFLSLAYEIIKSLQKSQLNARYAEQYPLGVPSVNEVYYIMESAVDWMTSAVPRLPQPYLAYIHLLPPHEPYYPGKAFVDHFLDDYQPVDKPEHFASDQLSKEELRHDRRLYDAHIAFIDSEIGRLFAELSKAGVLENTYIILTSDHGELFERGIRGHVNPTLYESLIRVPLLIFKPGQTRREDIHTPTSAVDLMPTLMHLMGKQPPEWSEGKVLPGFQDGEPAPRNLFVMDAKDNPKNGPIRKGTIALIAEQYKLIHYIGQEKARAPYELYDLASDPEELRDLYTSHHPTARELIAVLDQKLAQINQLHHN